MTYGLGDLLNDQANFFDVSLPALLVNQLNDKIGFNENDQLEFALEDASGFLGLTEGKVTWNNGQNNYNYAVEAGVEGSYTHHFDGPVDQFWKDLLNLPNWQSASEDVTTTWNIDFVNLQAEFSYEATQNVLASNYYIGSESHTFTYEDSVKFEVEATDDSFELIIKPVFKVSGWNTANPDLFGEYWGFNEGDADYKSTITLSVPNLVECENYFDSDFNAKDQCSVIFETSDLDDPIELKLRPKFAFIKFDNYMAYVKSETFDGTMIEFSEIPYLSFYFTENANDVPFKTIKKKYNQVGEDLQLTIPVFAVVDNVANAFDDVIEKWTGVTEYALQNPFKAVYWMDIMVYSVKPNTFDFSDLVAQTRFGCGEYTNKQLQEDAKDLSNFLYEELKNVDFAWLEDVRAFVVEVQEAESEVALQFVLPE